MLTKIISPIGCDGTIDSGQAYQRCVGEFLIRKSENLKSLSAMNSIRDSERYNAKLSPSQGRRTGNSKMSSPVGLIVVVLACSVHLCLSLNAPRVYIEELEQQQQQQQQSSIVGQAPIANDVIAIKEGADLDLSCPIVVKNEDMIISWTCDDEPASIRSSRIHVTESGKLRIHSAKMGDSCNYRCEAADGHGALSVIIRVIIVEKRLLDELARRLNSRPNSSSIHTSDEIKSDASPKRFIGGSPPSQTLQFREIDHAHQPTQGNPQAVESKILPQELGTEIEVQIEPSEVNVAKNKTFSLECRIRYASHMVAPHIIWLKEYIGPQVDSITDAIDRNLIYLDGIYYHSLNWPRAITYSQRSSSASSALLIRQSSHVHSGRYVCFAGYPLTVNNLHNNVSLVTDSARKSATSSLSAAASNDVTAQTRPPLKYKMSQAIVHVDDKEGELSYRAARKGVDGEPGAEGFRRPTNMIMSVLSTNTWQRNLTIILLFLCSSLLLAKVMLMRQKTQKSPLQVTQIKRHGAEVVESPPTTTSPSLLPMQTGSYGPPGRVSERPRVDSMFLSSNWPDLVRDRFSDVPANSLTTSSNPLREEYRIDQDLLSERLNRIDAGNNEHVYSEIGLIATEEPYYKQPNKNM